MSENGTTDVLEARPVNPQTREGVGAPQVVEGTWTVVGDAPHINNDKSGGGERGGEIKKVRTLTIWERARGPNGGGEIGNGLGRESIEASLAPTVLNETEKNNGMGENGVLSNDQRSGEEKKGKNKGENVDWNHQNEQTKTRESDLEVAGLAMREILLDWGVEPANHNEDLAEQVQTYLGSKTQLFREKSLIEPENRVAYIISNDLGDIIADKNALMLFANEAGVTLDKWIEGLEDGQVNIEAAKRASSKWKEAAKLLGVENPENKPIIEEFNRHSDNFRTKFSGLDNHNGLIWDVVEELEKKKGEIDKDKVSKKEQFSVLLLLLRVLVFTTQQLDTLVQHGLKNNR